MTLLFDGQLFTLYAGIILLVACVVGNGINILVFSRVRIYRTNPCTFYFLMGSIDNMFYVCFNLPIRILSDTYRIDTYRGSDVWCKIRHLLLVVPSLISVTFSCLAIIDQFLVTSKSAYLRSRAGTVKNLNRQMIEYLVSTITTLGTYLYYVGSCYTFLLTSNRFRQRARKIE
ncbi:unnamed protein product [Adineta ricciae]|uniref:G-protein coupled receptors family 1 profile domain-containing protein n=1 Tax=Adineta ricciae TaxID=249248 RepID=A0A815K8J7_ADIRI|nr:unnamed protein product [Adineta ricciae]